VGGAKAGVQMKGNSTSPIALKPSPVLGLPGALCTNIKVMNFPVSRSKLLKLLHFQAFIPNAGRREAKLRTFSELHMIIGAIIL